MVLKSYSDLEKVNLQVWRASEGEFLLGDQAIVSLDRFGLPIRGQLFGEYTHLLPVGRRTMIALGPEPEEVTLSIDGVETVNRFQLQIADRFVYFHPHAGLAAFCDEHRGPATSSTDLTAPDEGRGVQ